MESQSNTRKEIATILTKLAKIEEDLKAVSEFAETAAARVKAQEMIDSDVVDLGLKWKSVEHIERAADDPLMQLAIQRLMNSSLVSRLQAKIVKDCLLLFIDRDLLGRLCINAPAG